ncbi:MAG: ornithine carbamoyltransferase [Proteobacteria bacterium]|nr:ornithine carbamoyltransferase [Pseudomonadota bacterium]
MKKDLLSLFDLETDDFDYLFNRAIELKKRHKQGIFDQSLAGKSVGMIFDKPSTRTRISFEAATIQLAGTPIFMNSGDTQISRNEPVEDTARVLSRYIDCLVVRTYSQKLIEDYAGQCTIPVINALSDQSHPCQILSDLMTVIEYKGGYQGLKIAWIGDGNNVAHSWINAASVLGFELVLSCPEGYTPDTDILDRAWARNTGIIRVTPDPVDAVADADVVYTDVWASMGQEDELEARMALFRPYQVNAKLLDAAKKDVCVMHCLPAHRDEEITHDVIEGRHSIVWDQAENKLHMHKAILETLILKHKNH